jgi:hypothetical protein
VAVASPAVAVTSVGAWGTTAVGAVLVAVGVGVGVGVGLAVAVLVGLGVGGVGRCGLVDGVVVGVGW